MNKVALFGNVGKDPEVKTIGKNKVAKFSLATNKTYTDGEGNKVTDTQWHNIVYWNKLAELCEKYVKKGSSIIVEGEIAYRSYENKDGQTVYVTEIVGRELHFTGKKEDDTPKSNGEWRGKKEVKSMSDVNELPGYVTEQQEASANDNLPF